MRDAQPPQARAEVEVEVPPDRPRPSPRGYRALLQILTVAAERAAEQEEAAA